MNTHNKIVLPLLAAVCAAASPVLGDTFTIGVIPDTQNYVDYTASNPAAAEQQFLNETNYLANNKTALNLAFVTQWAMWSNTATFPPPNGTAPKPP